jgi:NDP-sugar pyrophosphorylase family protein
VTTATDGRVVEFAEKTKSSREERQLVNAGIYFLKKDIFEQCGKGITYSLEKELMPSIIKSGIYGYECAGKLIDIGTPESYSRSQEYFSAYSVDSE